jgi:phytoene dehydrogenase-like protein
MRGDADFDGILLGAGHNSLILQAYLCRAGLSVLCLERRDVAGGGLNTVEDPQLPGFFHNTHSFFHRAVREAPWYADLELERHGASYVEPELNVALLLKSGGALEWWTDFERTAASVERFSTRDAATMRRWREAFLPVVERILLPESRTPPLPPERRRALLERSPEGRLLLDTSPLSPLAFVEREFEHPVVRAGLLFFSYIGFDAVSTAAEETRKPSRDLPIGILGSLAVCTLLYIAIGFVATALVPVEDLMRGADPLNTAVAATGKAWAKTVVSVGATASMLRTSLSRSVSLISAAPPFSDSR